MLPAVFKDTLNTMTLPRRQGTYVGHQGNNNPSRDDAGVHN